MSAPWLIPTWIIGAPLVAVMLSGLLFRGPSSMGRADSMRPY